MTERDYKNAADKIAVNARYDQAVRKDVDYKGLRVFEGEGHKGDVLGYPLFILAGAGKVRRADIHETYDIMGMLTQEAK
ncbi:MAG: hypothetical protein LKE33_05665 [Acidaminococcus sp.]|jgi:hypothetical protein|nr:hypothetical protein [Acidaminococcus sp.]MCI2100671.1 hypothetical protein [Acidaminococcus sp.]MCI2114992.1 hypothetical protein [Acidaminococcus sp.]MCI2117435.1 hypothetical protein [Acidaminococcus sp.]